MIREKAMLCLLILLLPALALAGFVDNGDGTVTDTEAGLMWQQATAPGTYTWQGALVYCEGLTLAGHDDWRLPNRNELQSLVDYSQHSPAIGAAFSLKTEPSSYWSSTALSGFADYAWCLSFYDGWVYGGYKPGYCNVRAVRSAPHGAEIPAGLPAVRLLLLE